MGITARCDFLGGCGKTRQGRESSPQALKRNTFSTTCGTTEVVPFPTTCVNQNFFRLRSFPDWLDRAERDLRVPAHGRGETIPRIAAQPDGRHAGPSLQLLLIAFCFGSFFEGAAGFGTPVAVTAALLIGLGFKPLQASGRSLIANTAPVAFGALGTPIIAMAKVTEFSEITLGTMAGRILCPFCVLVPFWLIWAFAGWSGMMEIWPAILVAGVSFAIPELLMSNLHGPWLVNIVAAIVSMACLIGLLFIWHPKRVWTFEGEESKTDHRADHGFTR